jgi:hypothetical protein
MTPVLKVIKKACFIPRKIARFLLVDTAISGLSPSARYHKVEHDLESLILAVLYNHQS